MMLASDVMRAKFRTSLEKPKPLTPGQPTRISFELSDKLHRFVKGHRMMVHIQSTWFPLVDLNPGTFVDIYRARSADFQITTQRVYHSKKYPTHLNVGILK
jgi:hypothetical protein